MPLNESAAAELNYVSIIAVRGLGAPSHGYREFTRLALLSTV